MSQNNKSEILEDYLENDQQIPGQNFVCLSFVSPESIIEKKEVFYMNEFFKKTCEEMGINKNDALNYLKKYEDFKFGNKDTLDKFFAEQNDFVTSVRGLKIRGVYDTIKEAQVRAKVLQRRDPNFHVYVGQVGFWLPWEPEPHKIQNEEYLESQLNELVKNYKQNQKDKDDYFATDTKIRSEQAKKEGIENQNNKIEVTDLSGTEDKELIFDSRSVSKASEKLDNMSLSEKQETSDENLKQIEKEIFDM